MRGKGLEHALRRSVVCVALKFTPLHSPLLRSLPRGSGELIVVGATVTVLQVSGGSEYQRCGIIPD